MRAKASIPAWAKLAIGVVVVTALGALLAVAPWQPRDSLCTALVENIETVARTGVWRTSDLFHVEVGATRPRETRVVRGDFSGSWAVDQIRGCLGVEWTENHNIATAAAQGESWVFVRAGGPMVIYTQSIRQPNTSLRTELEARVVIEPIETD